MNTMCLANLLHCGDTPVAVREEQFLSDIMLLNELSKKMCL